MADAIATPGVQEGGQSPAAQPVTEQKPEAPKAETKVEAKVDPAGKPDEKVPFNKDPMFNRLYRESQSAKKLAGEAINFMKEFREEFRKSKAEEKGEEYVPQTEQKGLDYDSLWGELDTQIESFGKEHNLSLEDQEAIRELADKWGEPHEKGKVPMRADIALELWKHMKELQTPQKEEKKPAPTTKPSKTVAEEKSTRGMVDAPQYKSADHMWADMRAQAAMHQ